MIFCLDKCHVPEFSEGQQYKSKDKSCFGRSCTCTQVSRRHGYKGNVASMLTGFPLDVCTLPGFCATLAIILSARGLAKTLLDRALDCFTFLNQMAETNVLLKLIPDSQDCWVDVQNGCLGKEDLKRVLNHIGVDFARPGLSKIDWFSKAHCSF